MGGRKVPTNWNFLLWGHSITKHIISNMLTHDQKNFFTDYSYQASFKRHSWVKFYQKQAYFQALLTEGERSVVAFVQSSGLLQVNSFWQCEQMSSVTIWSAHLTKKIQVYDSCDFLFLWTGAHLPGNPIAYTSGIKKV